VRYNKSILSALAGMAMLALPASALAGHHHEWNGNQRPFAWHDQGEHRGWFKHHGYDARPVRVEDEDDEGEHCRRPVERTPAFLCDDDGDDCRPAGANYWGGYDYGPPVSYYQAAPPAGYGRAQRRAFLLRRRARAYYVLRMMRARHDYRAERRMAGVISSLNGGLGRGNRMAVGGYRAPSPYYDSTAYNPDSSYSPGYQPNPRLNMLTNMVGPLLGTPSY
jgi:hypothetical protein